MRGSSFLVCLLCFCAIAESLAYLGDEKDDDLDAAGGTEPDEDTDDVGDEDVPPAAASPGACPHEFRDKCTCGRVDIVLDDKKYRRFVTNCTNSGFKDASVLKSLPTRTEILIFTGNNLTELPQNVFGNNASKQYDRLKVINLSNNRITTIHGKTFHNVRNVARLTLDNNRLLITGAHFHPRFFSNFDNLEELYLRNAFGDADKGDKFMADLVTMLTEANLSKLRVLRLDNNTIQSIPNAETFCSLESLQYLHLSQNFLVDAKINTSCFKRLKVLDISDNFIVSLGNETLAMYERPKGTIFHLNMTKNPFRCDCNFLPLYNWLKVTNTWVVGIKNFRCMSGFPEKNTGRSIIVLKETDFQCPEQPLEADMNSGYVTASYAVLISLSMALAILLSALIYSNREHLSKTWTFLSNSLAAKREYTSLEQESKRAQQMSASGEVDEVSV